MAEVGPLFRAAPLYSGTMTRSPVTVRRVTDPAHPALDAFARIQQSSYYAPDMLIPPQMFPDLVAGRRPERQDRLLVAEDESGAVLGGTLYHLLPGAGFNSFTPFRA